MKKIASWTAILLMTMGCDNISSKAGSPSSGILSDPTQAQITWNADLGEQQGFYVEQSTDGVSFAQVLSVTNGVNAATVSGLSTGHTYYFKVRAYNQIGSSADSPVVTVSR